MPPGARDGQFFARLRIAAPGGITDVRRVALSRRNGRFSTRPAFYRRASCGAVSSFKLERPVFGGRTNRALDASYRLGAQGRLTLELLRGSRVIRRLAPVRTQLADRTYRVRVASEKLRRGDHRVRLTVVANGRRTVALLTAKRL